VKTKTEGKKVSEVLLLLQRPQLGEKEKKYQKCVAEDKKNELSWMGKQETWEEEKKS